MRRARPRWDASPRGTEGGRPSDGRRQHEQALVALSHRIHAHPELCFEETQSSAWTAGALADGGLAVETGVGGLDTAFVARAGSGPLHLAICAEYDALPGIGHACGHNIIAATAVGAGLALAPLADDLGLTISVVGTPAEEGGGGKVYLLERGVFDGMHAAMMVHPAPFDVLRPRVSAVAHFTVRYTGRESHAAAARSSGSTPPTRSSSRRSRSDCSASTCGRPIRCTAS